MSSQYQHRRRRLVLLLLLTLVRGLIYASLIPPWQAPDETGHFEYAWSLAHLKRMPTRQDRSDVFEQELLASLYEWHYGEFINRALPEQMPSSLNDLPAWIFAQRDRTLLAGRFSLSYIWQAIFIWPVLRQDLLLQLFLARFSSILINVGIVLLSYLVFTELVPAHRQLACMMTLVVILVPQHTFINSMVGDGPLAELATCWVIYCWVHLFSRGFSVWKAAGIVLGIAVGIWSKATAVFLMPLSAGLGLWWLWPRLRRIWRWQYLAYLGIGAILAGAGIYVWLNSAQGYRMIIFARRLANSSLTWIDNQGVTFGEANLLSFDSFWANFGWMSLPVSERWYGSIAMLSIIAIVGLATPRFGRDVPLKFWAIIGGTLLAAWVSFALTALLSRSTYQIQGRYLLPVIIPYAFVLTLGLKKVFADSWHRYAAGTFLLFLICFDTVCLAAYILPAYYT